MKYRIIIRMTISYFILFHTVLISLRSIVYNVESNLQFGMVRLFVPAIFISDLVTLTFKIVTVTIQFVTNPYNVSIMIYFMN